METPRRTYPRLRRVAVMAALAALLAPAGQAEAAKKILAKHVLSGLRLLAVHAHEEPVSCILGSTQTTHTHRK